MRDRAKAAALEIADSPTHVGEWLGSEMVGDVQVVRFASLHPGYPGWRWSVALVGDGEAVSINEIWMEPGEGALTVPAWKPWSERVRPGDLGPGDVVPTAFDDPRLQPGYAAVDESEQVPPQWEIGLGRERVLSPEGFAEAVDRWRSGEDGPDAQIARLADHPCSTCGWLLALGGAVGQAFGACANPMSPSDGHIVALDHGCGAHSDVVVEPSPVPVTDLLIDDEEIVVVDRGSLPVAEARPTSDDVQVAEDADDDARPGDITPPEAAVRLEGAGEERGEDGEDGPDDGADNAGLDAVEVEPAQLP